MFVYRSALATSAVLQVQNNTLDICKQKDLPIYFQLSNTMRTSVSWCTWSCPFVIKSPKTHVEVRYTGGSTHTQKVVRELVYFAITASTGCSDLTLPTEVSVTASLQQLFPWQHVLCMLFIDTDSTGCSNDIDWGTLLCFLRQVIGARPQVCWHPVTALTTGFHLPSEKKSALTCDWSSSYVSLLLSPAGAVQVAVALVVGNNATRAQQRSPVSGDPNTYRWCT